MALFAPSGQEQVGFVRAVVAFGVPGVPFHSDGSVCLQTVVFPPRPACFSLIEAEVTHRCRARGGVVMVRSLQRRTNGQTHRDLRMYSLHAAETSGAVCQVIAEAILQRYIV